MDFFEFHYNTFPKLQEKMYDENKTFFFIEKGQTEPPYQLWDLQSVNKDFLGGGVVIGNFKTGELYTKPTMSKQQIVKDFKSQFPSLDSKLVMKKLLQSDEYSTDYKMVHHGRFLTYSD